MKLLIVLACVLIITAAALDVRCGAARATPDTVIIVCRAGRLEQLAGHR
jgi:hypothetical protein